MASVRFLFWNLYGRAEKNRAVRSDYLRASLARQAVSRQLDILIFAECDIAPTTLVADLNGLEIGTYYAVPSKSRRVRFFARLQAKPLPWDDLFSESLVDRIAIQELRCETIPSILLAAVHFHDRWTIPTEAGRALAVTEIVRELRQTEVAVNHLRTVLVGDLNMNPFEAGVVGTQALHAVLSRDLAHRVQHLSRREDYPCFYNPMWSVFGDRSAGPAGTHFFANPTDPVNHFWHVYDQVLLRPAVMDTLIKVEVLDHDGQESLVTTAGRPRKATFSDHLPLFFELRL